VIEHEHRLVVTASRRRWVSFGTAQGREKQKWNPVGSETDGFTPAGAADLTSSSNQLLELLATPGVARARLSQSGDRLAVLAIRIGPKVEDAISDERSEVDDVDWHRPHQRDGVVVRASPFAR
jgi:hypothetical protein